MSQALWADVDDYLGGLFAADPMMESVLAANAAAGLPAHDVSPLQGKLLFVLGLAARARSILEIGTLGGYSTIWLARAVGSAGRVVTLEADSGRAAVAEANLVAAGLRDRVEVRVGRALDTLPALASERPAPAFDLIFIDADKPSNPDYLKRAIELAHPGTVIVVDNVVREGAILDPDSGYPSVAGSRRVNELFAAHPRIVATALQTVGSKGHDGFAIGVVTEAA